MEHAAKSWKQIPNDVRFSGMINSLAIATVLVGAGGLIGLLVWLLIFVLVMYVVFLVLGMIPLPPQARNIVTLLIGLIFLLILLSHLGVVL